MNVSLKDQVCLVTGASGDIGGEIARTFKSAGATVIGWGNGNLPCLDLALEQNVDVTREDQVESAFEAIDKKFARLDILVTSAGITLNKLFLRQDESDWLNVFQTNVTGSYLCSKEAAKRMVLQKSGSILFISSLAAHYPHVGQTAYAASKGAIESLTRSLAVELAPKKIRVNALAPGFVESRMINDLDADLRKKILSRIPLARFASPVEIAATAQFLVSQEASYMTGQVLGINGGLGM